MGQAKETCRNGASKNPTSASSLYTHAKCPRELGGS